MSSKRRTDRIVKTFLFCPKESCIDTFESEEKLESHILIDQHTTKESSLRTNDKVKLMLFEKMKDMNTGTIIQQPTTTTTTAGLSIPRHAKPFTIQGWALRKRKPYKPIDKDVKAFIKAIFEEEKSYGCIYRLYEFQKESNFYYIQGRKIKAEEYVNRIRTARNPDLTKKFNTNQYLTQSQVE